MKTLKFILALVMAMSAGRAAAQEFGPEWGENATADERRQNVLLFNFYQDAYKAGRYDDAIRYYNELIVRAPKAQMSTYLYAINIYKSKAARAKSVGERTVYVDSMIMVYDARIASFGNDPKMGKPYILKLKANDYAAITRSANETTIALYRDALDANIAVGNIELTFLNQYFNFLTSGYLNDEIETDDYLDEYERLAEIVESQPTEGNEEQLKTFESLFVSSNAANCDKLEEIFTARLANDPNNVEQLRKAFAMLSSRHCSSEFYFSVGERYFVAEPSTQIALTLAASFEAAGRYSKALEYLRSAVATENDPLEQAKLCTQIASTELQMENYQSAADFARRAIGYNPEYGFAYLILGYAYVGGTRSCGDAFDQRTVYWLAYDVTRTAVSKLTDEAQVKMANEALSRYAPQFPNREDLFFRGINIGSGYTVRCGWISGSTSVRSSD